MFYLTPQERVVLSWFLTACLIGALVYYGVHSDAKPLRWTSTAAKPFQKRLPDLNTSPAEQLEKLPGIGLKTAGNIVAYRMANGPFLRLEDLRKVKGITKANFKKIEEAYAHP
jgi:competence ComEA-like helix-hairpin-helix protein